MLSRLESRTDVQREIIRPEIDVADLIILHNIGARIGHGFIKRASKYEGSFLSNAWESYSSGFVHCTHTHEFVKYSSQISG